MLEFDNFDLNYADSNAFWEFFGILDIVPGMFWQEYLIITISYIQ